MSHLLIYFTQEALSAVNFITQAPLRATGSYAADTTMGANSSSHEGLANNRNLARPHKEETPFRLLTIRILRARNIQKADIFTESDCYVCLSLPTATSEKVRTITVSNSKNPVWNQSFCYRIDSRVKNILELKVCDEDTFTKDDHLFTVLFDVGKLQTGRTSRVNFNLNPATQEELEVEFTLQPIPDDPENIITNGTLVSREVSCLEVTVDIEKLKEQYTEGDLTLTIKGSYEETQKIPLAPDTRPSNRTVIQFHCIKNHQSNLEIILPKKMQWSKLASFKGNSDSNISVVLPLDELPMEKTITLRKDTTFDLHVKAKDWSKDLDVRLAYDLCAEEQNFLTKRRKYVATAVKKILQLKEKLQDDELPVVAIMTTGGGTRSFAAMYGSLLGLQKLNFLDCITYLTGLSGTTWTMGNLYEDADWSQKYLEEAILKARKQVTKSKLNSFSMDKLKYYYNELKQRSEEGHNTSFIDLWGLVIESMLHDEKDNSTISGQRMAVNEGQNPLPIYLTVNLKDQYSAQDYKEWLEFTPYEVGNFKYGAYTHSEDFGSEYFMGRLMKKLPESRICFMQGMWSSIFSMDFMYFWNLAHNSEDFWSRWTKDKVEDIDASLSPSGPRDLETRKITPQGQLSYALRDVLTGRPTIAEYPNFLKGFQFHEEYLKNEHFSAWKDTVVDDYANQLMETAEHALSLVDTGFFINTSYPPLLRPERKVDLILHLNYTGGSQTLNLDQFSTYIAKLGIPFPNMELSEEDKKNLKECYWFEDTDNAAAPIVLFFPLTNDTFRKYKEPGVERSPTDMEEGNVDVSSFHSPFATREVTFSEENFDRLVKLTEYNILNNENKIVEALRVAVERRKKQKL
ncbi:cytosolic phospholipase A2 epsilon-like [Podarcis raffonei]|uniref:cytosolic phospholipase A2 epsilon-like n=1 Tax=Podarcis raffonei TaxID=65483 RepID=UPI00232910BD|nr:cytosolic phospholipase A2 epsilon-like [Podarcis raffonei]